MTRKDYELIAATVRRLGEDPGIAQVRGSIAWAFADALRSTNPLFDRDRFLSACGVRP